MNLSLARMEPKSIFEQVLRKALLEQIHLELPEAWQLLRQQAFARFEQLGFPSNRDEAWKYIDLRPLIDTPFHLSTESHVTLDVPSGAKAITLLDAWQDPEMALRLGKILNPTEVTDAFAVLNLALATHGWVLHIPKSTNLDELIRLEHYLPLLAQHALASQALLVILMDPAAKATMVLHSHSDPGTVEPRLANLTIMADLKPNAQLTVLQLQDEAQDVLHLDYTQLQLATGAEAHWTTLALGGQVARHAVIASLNGPLATASVNGLSVLKHRSQAFHHTEVFHQVQDTRSHQLYKGIVTDASRVEFDGTIVVKKDAQRTNAEQQNKHLLLSREAKVWSRPQLQIDADDVKCSHGASIGQLSEEELFYLASRGIGQQQAQQVLTLGFATEVTKQLPDPLQDLIHNRLMAQLASL